MDISEKGRGEGVKGWRGEFVLLSSLGGALPLANIQKSKKIQLKGDNEKRLKRGS